MSFSEFVQQVWFIGTLPLVLWHLLWWVVSEDFRQRPEQVMTPSSLLVCLAIGLAASVWYGVRR